MADNSSQTGTDTIRDKDRAGVKTQVVGLDLNIGGSSELLMGPSARHDASASGTFAAPTLRGFAIRETSGSGSAVVRIRDGSTVGGTLLVPISLSPGESTSDWFGLAGIAAGSGNLYIEVVSGTVEGSVFA